MAINLIMFKVKSFTSFKTFLDDSIGKYYVKYRYLGADNDVVEKQGILVLKDTKRILLWDGEKVSEINISLTMKDTDSGKFASKVYMNKFTISNNTEIHEFEFFIYSNTIDVY